MIRGYQLEFGFAAAAVSHLLLIWTSNDFGVIRDMKIDWQRNEIDDYLTNRCRCSMGRGFEVSLKQNLIDKGDQDQFSFAEQESAENSVSLLAPTGALVVMMPYYSIMPNLVLIFLKS